MKLITESIEEVKVLTEEKDGIRSLYITGPFLVAEMKNRNGRMYKTDTLAKEVNRYSEEYVSKNRAFGELGHPDSPSINLDRVSHLILGAPWTHGDADLHVLQNTRMAAARTMPADFYIHFNSMLIYPPEFRRKHFQRFEMMAAKALQSPQDPVAISARLDAILAFDARELYKNIKCPALVLGARDDLVMPYWFAQDAAAAISNSRLVIYEHGGHMFPETRTSDFLQDVNSFLT